MPDQQFIRLDHFLKRRGVVGSGGQAKNLIQNENVSVNSEIETRRGKKLCLGDVVALDDAELTVQAEDLGLG